jgi:hypothetical protein
MHRAADPPRAAHVASQPHRLAGLASAGITHVCSIAVPAFPALSGDLRYAGDPDLHVMPVIFLSFRPALVRLGRL